MQVAELLRLAPFSLGTITILLAAGGLIFGHAYGRYGDDAAISFLLRWRFVFAAVLVAIAPAMMLYSFGSDGVPHWLTPGRAAALVGLGIATTAVVVGYLLLGVSRPGRFLGAVGKRVTVRRLNRYMLATRWRQEGEFDGDISARRYRWFGYEMPFLADPKSPPSRAHLVRWKLVVGWMRVQKVALSPLRTDPSEMLFDAASAGLRNGNMRTWRCALEVIATQLCDSSLTTAAAECLVANAQALEEIAHRQGSEDCKVRLNRTLGLLAAAPLAEATADTLARGISSLAERRLGEQRPVLAAIEGLRTIAASNGLSAVKAIGWLGQHLVVVAPPVAVYGFDGDYLEHTTQSLFDLLGEIAEQADRDDDGRLNDAVIDACAMISRALPGAQDRETVQTLAAATRRSGVSAAQRYGAGKDWHGTYEAVDTLVRLQSILDEVGDGESGAAGIAEDIAVIGSWVASNREQRGFRTWKGRSDMAVAVSKQLLTLPSDSIGAAFVEMIVRQHNSEIPRDNCDEFIGLCQRISGELLGLAVVLDMPSEAEGDKT